MHFDSNLLDSNLAMDRNKIAYVAQLPNGEGVVMQALVEGHPLNVAQLADRFGVEDVLQAAKDHTFMTSLLYYFGVLTLAGTRGHAMVVFNDSFYAFKAQLQAFVDFLRTGERPFPFSETVELMRIVIAGIRSRQESGRIVQLKEIKV